MTNKPQKYVEISEDLAWVLKSPRLTEKAARLGSDNNVYTFNVDQRANKVLVKKAIKALYKVSPTKVNITVKKPEVRVFRGRMGQTPGEKKAMVFLKKGDTIDFS